MQSCGIAKALIIFEVNKQIILLLAQQANIVYLLLCHLNQHLWFEIPGLGVFKGRKSVTYLDHIENKIYPANLTVEFLSESTLRTETMIQNMASESGYEQELLEEHLAALCQAINEALKKNNSFDFLPFGTISKDNEKLIFNQSKNNIHQEFYWMEALSIYPEEFQHREVKIPAQVIPIQKVKSKKELNILLIALGILWLIFLSLLLWPHFSKSHKTEKVILTKDSVTATPFVDTIKLPQVSTVVQDSVNEYNKKDSSKVNSDTSGQFKHETVIDSGNVKELNEQIKNKPCIIIVGSFIKRSNAEQLSKKLSKNKYQVYRGEYGKFNRVGIQFNCFDHDLQQMLGELKKKFHPDAWVLKF